MKKLLCMLIAVLGLSAAHAQTTALVLGANNTAANEALELKAAEHDFGKIPQNKPVYYSFEFTNKGSGPLKIDNVHASCGCTTPEWSKEPIPAGGTSTIKVGYNAASEGDFEKYITITYNGNQTKQIKIKGTVWRAPQGSAPANPSLQFLKQQIQ